MHSCERIVDNQRLIRELRKTRPLHIHLGRYFDKKWDFFFHLALQRKVETNYWLIDHQSDCIISLSFKSINSTKP